MQKNLLYIIIAVVVIGGGYFLLKGKQPAAPSYNAPVSTAATPKTTPTAPAEKNVVTYSDSGYSPKTLNIKTGETVTFKNTSSRAMWTASAVHPSHAAYPTTGGCIASTFDACVSIRPGASWTFKFDLAGSWKYHNHVNPADTGTIVVE
ncbi:hypothetical protein EPN90_04395 [Patescibacteria group bacterium]|nr:MAG: hypothetical protein EPN90_04395 [Patescibacteria group bacterium]